MHAALKRETAQLHRRLNTLPNARLLLTPRLHISDYSAILLAYAKAYQPMEDKLNALEKEVRLGNLHNYVPRIPAIQQDIGALSEFASLNKIDARPLSVAFDAHILPHYLGLRYVIDGSTQGGAYIERKLRKNLPELAIRAFSFWTVQGAAAADWPQLCASIDRVGERPEQAAEMIGAAKAGFQLFIDCFSYSG